MLFIEVRNVSRVYKSQDGQEEKYALDHVSFSLPSKGLIAIIGKSGSGKSTIINMLGLLDKPTSGHIYINKESINNWKRKRIEQYHNKDIGIIFQHYHLLDNHTVIYNIMISAMIAGDKEKVAKQKAIQALESISFPKNLYNNKVKDLSGGEKERVAILRAIINNPKILLCDEPTGALDSKNSIAVMELLKTISKDRLVVLVSHNLILTKEYADRIITIKDGKIEKDESINPIEESFKPSKKEKYGHNPSWSNKITFQNFKRRIVRNLISIITLTIGLVSTLLIIGFSNGSAPSISEVSYKQLDYGVITLSKEISENIAGSKMSLVQQSRPKFEDLEPYKDILNDYEIENNFSALVPSYLDISLGEEKLTEFTYHPIYSFSKQFIDKTLLIHGYFPAEDNLFEVVINKRAHDLLKQKGIPNPLDINLNVSYDKEFHFYTGDERNPSINDVFSYQKTIHIVGVVDEMNFLSTPKIYYSYKALVEYLFDYPVNNLSLYYEKTISWYERVATASGSDEISFYSYYLFLKDINNASEIADHINQIKDPFVLESAPVTLRETLLNLVDAATMGMGVFLIIAILGTALILGIVSFSSYSEDKKVIAILSCLGANRNDITDIYVLENIIVAVIALLFSFLLSPLLSILANFIIQRITGFSHMIDIPYLRYMGYPFFLPLLIIVITLFIAVIATLLPISFSSKISLKKELMDE